MKKKEMLALKPGDLVRLAVGYGNTALEDRRDLLVAEVVNARVSKRTIDAQGSGWSYRTVDLLAEDVEPDGSCVAVRDVWRLDDYRDERVTYANKKPHLVKARQVLELFTPEVEDRVRATRASHAAAEKARADEAAAKRREAEGARDWLRENLPPEFEGLLRSHRPEVLEITYVDLRRMVEAARGDGS